MTTTVTSATTTARRPAPASVWGGGLAATVLAAAGTLYGAHDWTEIAVTVPVLAVVAAFVFGFVVPAAMRKESAGGTALGLSIPAVLLTLPAFWSGLPMVLGVAGVMVGNAGRNARSGGGKCIAGLVLGALAVLGYLAIYIGDGIIGGNAGFLFD
ncbi:MAG: hypothetical protein M3P34_05890 [Actinomycetota bacterium]|nr:hypothetical protein [Actinomycetota bacterium]